MTIDSTITLERMEVSQRRLLPLFLLALLLLALAVACGFWAYSYGEGWKPYMAAGLFSFWGLSCVLMAGNSSAKFDKRTDRAEIRRSCVNGRFKTSHLWALQNQPGSNCSVHILQFPRRACPS